MTETLNERLLRLERLLVEQREELNDLAREMRGDGEKIARTVGGAPEWCLGKTQEGPKEDKQWVAFLEGQPLYTTGDSAKAIAAFDRLLRLAGLLLVPENEQEREDRLRQAQERLDIKDPS